MNEKKTEGRKSVWDNFHLISIFPFLDNGVEKMAGLELQRILEEIDYQDGLQYGGSTGCSC